MGEPIWDSPMQGGLKGCCMSFNKYTSLTVVVMLCTEPGAVLQLCRAFSSSGRVPPPPPGVAASLRGAAGRAESWVRGPATRERVACTRGNSDVSRGACAAVTENAVG